MLSAAEIEVWALSSLHRVKPEDGPQASNAVWDGATRTVKLAGARNEHVPFQIAISAPLPGRRQPPVSGLFVEAEELRSASGRIARDQIRLYLEHLVLCYAPSSPVGGSGFFPDALAPLTDPFPLAAEFRRNVRTRAVWADIAIPEDVPAEEYSGAWRVLQHGRTIETLHVKLKVYDFALPRENHLVTYMGISRRNVARAHEVPESSPQAKELLQSYYQLLYENRMEPWFNEWLAPRIEKKDGEIAVSFDEEAYELAMNRWRTRRVILETVPGELRRLVGDPPFSETFQRAVRSYLTQVAAYFRRKGWQDRLVFNSPIDEPNSAEQYEETRRWATLVKQAAPGIPFLVTEAPVPDRPEWGPLTGYATHFSVHGNQLNRAEVREAIRKEQARGGEITWYISCDQRYPQPNYFIDGPMMDPVMVPWITWRLGLNGILYWSLTFWSQTVDPWLNPVTYLSGYFCSDGWVLNGEGSLLYPGNRVFRYTGQRNVAGPVRSIRFELLREGLEDYELLWLLKSKGEERAAEEAAAALVTDVRTFSRDAELLLQWRERLAARLESPSRPPVSRAMR